MSSMQLHGHHDSPFNTIIRTLWKRTTSIFNTRTNERHPWEELAGVSYQLAFAINIWCTWIPIERQEQLFVKEAWLYERRGEIGHDFIVFAIYDFHGYDGSKPVAYIRVERFSKAEMESENERKNGGNSVVQATQATVADSETVYRDGAHELVPISTPQAPMSTHDVPENPSQQVASNPKTPRHRFAEIQDKFYLHKTLGGALQGQSVRKYQQAVLFTESDRVEPLRLLAIASAISDVAPDSKVQSQNYQFFAKMLLELAVGLLSGKPEDLKGGNSGESALPFLVDAPNPEYTELFDRAKEMFPKKWIDAEQTRQVRQSAEQRASFLIVYYT
ncbi:hypothetical protein SCHPADRAFT_907197 [Schizopora paradoxa]|uniref:Uncharacterized protein n=1 Tax=Schizopora paradoxa TaxID=27342 RepID=A0A0H2RZ92_9AGAM|nr:hypothetical protein SCHPADRAFT_907197 [Schizopora paradoxa]